VATESELTGKVLRAIKQRFPGSFAIKINDRTTAGIPDAILVVQGFVFFVEFKKMERGESAGDLWAKVSAIQRAMMAQLVRAGARVLLVGLRNVKEHVVWDIDDAGGATPLLLGFDNLLELLDEATR
jgi:hypothetical protein